MSVVQSMFGKKNAKVSSDVLVKTFKGKDILVTGGCGSIGTEIVKQLAKYHPKRIRVFDHNESGLFNLQQEVKSFAIRILVGDIRDKERLRLAVRGCDYVFHAAALKHVPLCEYNPFEAVSTNVVGTQNLVTVCREEKVGKLVAISTDKAVNPINTMGATKLLSEKIVMTADIGEGVRTKVSCVRVGNVLNSVGSVIPIFMRQIEAGGPVTVTDPDMERFFMSIHQAVHLVLRCAVLSRGGDIFVLDMKKIKIIDLAEVMIEMFASKFGHDPKSMRIKMIGVRPGEKLDEQLVTEEEKNYLMHLKDMAVIRPARMLPYQEDNSVFNPRQISRPDYDMNKGVLLSKEEIRATLIKILSESDC